MKTIIAGSRWLKSEELIAVAVKASGFDVSEVVSGGARGTDRLGELWARRHNIPVKTFSARWGQFGLAAGPRRNKEMADYADALIALWDGRSRGTKDMIDKAFAARLDIYVFGLVSENP